MITKEEAYSKVSELVERFNEQFASYKKADYNEALTRRDFIDPFFKALGWDIDNSQGYSEANREVIHEDKLKIGSATKAPDYSFRLPGGKRQFFLEAKKPSVVVKDETAPAYQVRRYGWSAKLPISLITDFEEFAVYDCTKRPFDTDKASTARIKYLTYKSYLDEFDFIWNTFSKINVLKGGLEKYIQSDTQKKGTATVDKEFLSSLDGWRIQLALNIALRNKELSEDELNFVVQQTIDRLIFLRIAEDRKVEPYGQLQNLLKSGKEEGAFYKQLYTIFKEADSKYNSGLFDFRKDKLSVNITIENKVIKTIINELYYPVCPYEFSVLGVEILGSAYEQFLGKQIKLDKNHRAIIEEKPEVRKAGGVYYTPQYIVEYIVEQTVGKLAEGKTPEEVAKLKIVDPACGSGSFLLGAYDYLLKWHWKHYTPDFMLLSATAADNNQSTKIREAAIRQRNKLPLTPEGYLTTGLKKQILLNNIYGVDLDTQAVEVTKLSLLLKCMEGETASSINAEMRFGERVLPTLDNNIKSGNSLIDLDFYDAQIDFGEEKKIKPFSWEQAFPKVFTTKGSTQSSLRGTKQSANTEKGFDVVIGNPPYVRQEMLSDIKPYLQKKYKVYHGMADLYNYFIEKGMGLLNNDGVFGIIVANKWMRANYGEPLRRWFKEQQINQIIDFGDLPVFQNATTYPCIIVASKSSREYGNRTLDSFVVDVKTLQFESLKTYIDENKQSLILDKLEDSGWHLGNEGEQALLKKLQSVGIPLGDYVKGKIFRGVLTGLNEAFVIDEATKNKLIEQDERSVEVIKPFLVGRDIRRYQTPSSNKYLLFTRRGINIENYPAIKKHLLAYKEKLMPKPKDWKGEWKGRKPGTYLWYEIQDSTDYYHQFEEEKILWPGISSEVTAFSFDNQKFYGNDNNQLIISSDKFLLGILNSTISRFQLQLICDKVQGDFYRLKIIYIKQLSIINPSTKNEDALKEKIRNAVGEILILNKQKQSITLSEKIEQLNQRIAYTDDKINKLVYELYGLSEEEIAIVEGT